MLVSMFSGWFKKKTKNKPEEDRDIDSKEMKEQATLQEEGSEEVEKTEKEPQDIGEEEQDLEDEESPVTEEELDPANIYIPRVLYYKVFGSKAGKCPLCREELTNANAGYVFELNTIKGEEVILMGHDLGWFCHHCPTIVMNPDKLNGMLLSQIADQAVLHGFIPVGLLDIEALPEAPEEDSLDSDENSLPLFPFTDHRTFGRGSKRIQTPGSKGKRKKKKKKKKRKR